jgi:hypothetical protein
MVLARSRVKKRLIGPGMISLANIISGLRKIHNWAESIILSSEIVQADHLMPLVREKFTQCHVNMINSAQYFCLPTQIR